MVMFLGRGRQADAASGVVRDCGPGQWRADADTQHGRAGCSSGLALSPKGVGGKAGQVDEPCLLPRWNSATGAFVTGASQHSTLPGPSS
jgi:hypothetical protein